MTKYCENPVKLIRLIGSDKIQFQVWHTGQILVKPLSELNGLTFDMIRKLRNEANSFKQWYRENA